MSTVYGCSEGLLAHYTCHRTAESITVDGRLDKAAWRTSPRSGRFVDLVTGEPAFLDTRMSALWDDRHFYVAFWISEPNLRASLTRRDSAVYTENDVEVFIAGEDCYYEFQINALGTVCEVFYIWQDAMKKGSRFDRPEFDLYSRPVDILGGFQDPLRSGKHPRGARWAFRNWDFPGLQSAVHLDGKLNDSCTIDRGWTVELAFPWEGMRALFAEPRFPPGEGDVLRVDFSRFESLACNGRRVAPGIGWCLNPHGVYDSHIPECFSYVHFSTRTATDRSGR